MEVAHEALLRDWPTLRRWIAADREQLLVVHAIRDRTQTWLEAERDPSELARGGRLEVAAELAGSRPELFNADELEWIGASLDQARREESQREERAERDRRQNRRLRGLLVGAAVLLVLSLVGGSIAVWQRRVAVDSEAEAIAAEQLAGESAAAADEARAMSEQNLAAAQEAERIAQSAEADAEIERLVALSAAQFDVAPDTAMLVALEANRRRDDAVTRGAVQRSIATEPRLSRVIRGSSSDDFVWLAETERWRSRRRRTAS